MSEFMDTFGEWGNDEEGNPLPLTVKTFLGTGPSGRKYAAAQEFPGLPQFPQNRLVRTAQGDEALSSAAVYAPKELAVHFALQSLVTLADGREAAVQTVAKPDTFGLFGFVVVNLE